jgi:asparagine synthase (glutamine-hydrolysing)
MFSQRELSAAPPPSAREQPFLHLTARAGIVSVDGQREAILGAPQGSNGGAGEVFAEWRWDGQELVVRNDRLGFFPLYVAASASSIKLSPSIPDLVEAGVPAALDDSALAVFLRIGFFVGEDTPFAAIRALPPAARLCWRPGSAKLSGSPPATARSTLCRDDAIDRFAAAFRAAIVRCEAAGPSQAMPLSGGADSRHILLELADLGRAPPVCVTARYSPPRATPDAEVAAQIAQRLGLRHAVVEQPRSELQALLRHHRLTSYCTLTPSAWMLALADDLRRRTSVVYDGIGGDVLAAGLFLDEERARLYGEGRLEELAANLLDGFGGGGGYREPTLEAALEPSLMRRFARGLAVERLVQELRRHADAPNPFTSFCFFNRTRRDIALLPFRVYQGLRVRCPFLDPGVVDALASLPPRMTLDHSFHIEAIARAHPAWSALPYASWRGAKGSAARSHSRRLARELMVHLRGGLRARPLRAAFLAPRLARALIDPGYAAAAEWMAPLALYLSALEALRTQGG